MDGEVVHSLLALLDQSIPEYLPRQVFCLAVNLLERLIHGNGAYRHRTIAQNPLPCLVYIVACRQVHERIAAPLAAPHGFLHLLIYARRGGRVSYIGIYLDKEVCSDNHRFGLWMVYIGGNDGPACGHLISYKFRGDMRRDAKLGTVHVLANGYVLHFLGDDPALCQRHLRFSIPAALNPRPAEFRKTFGKINFHVRITVRTARIVYIHGGVLRHFSLSVLYAYRRCEMHTAHADTQFGIKRAANIYFLRIRISDFNVVVHIVCYWF